MNGLTGKSLASGRRTNVNSTQASSFQVWWLGRDHPLYGCFAKPRKHSSLQGGENHRKGKPEMASKLRVDGHVLYLDLGEQ